MDPTMKNWIRPQWITLLKLQTAKDLDRTALRFFGYKPGGPTGTTSEPYRADQFWHAMGINLNDYIGYFIEVGAADAPTGPVTPATEDLPLRPVLTFYQTGSGRYEPRAISFNEGFYNRDSTMAWVHVDLYEQVLGDEFFGKLMEQADRIDAAAERKEPS